MKRSFVFTKLFAISFLIAISINTVAQPSLFDKKEYISSEDTLRYRMLTPDYGRKQPFPLVIFLHGSGERGSDNDAQLKWGVMNFASDEQLKLHPAVIIAPQCPANEQWANIDFGKKDLKLRKQPSQSMTLLRKLIDQTIKGYPIDTTRIYITGLSMGGFGTFEAVMRYPDLFAAAVPVCGGGDISKAPDIVHIPIWIFTGAEDATVDPAYSFDMAQALVNVGANPGFTQYPEVGHFSWIAAYSDPMMIEWMFRQKKSR